MLIIPAIDILNGRCVRLYKGNYSQITEYGTDMLAITRRWIDQGATRIHLVDLDGAKAGHPVNTNAIITVVQEFPDTVFEVGGGIRQLQQVESYLNQGVNFVILGSIACQQPAYALRIVEAFPDQVLLGLDTHEGRVKISGWLDDTGDTTSKTLEPFIASSLAGIIHTDINRDGTLQGINLAASAELALASGLQVFASGGVGNIEDVHRLCDYQNVLAGAIVGKALYEGKLQLSDAIAICNKAQQ